MKKYLVVALCTLCTVYAEQRTVSDASKNPEPPQIVYIPVPVHSETTEYSDDQQQRDLFLAFMNIAGNFGKILLNPEDTPHVVEGVNSIINAVIYAADVATRASSRSYNYNEFVQAIAHYIQEQALLAQNAQSSLTPDAQKEEKSGREKLIDFALQQ